MGTVLQHDRIECLPLIHGRMAFATEARRRLLAEPFEAVAVELPRSLQPAVELALEALPAVSVVLYREIPAFLEEDDPRAWYVPVQPGDGIVEALRVARSERLKTWFVDAEAEDFSPAPVVLPDPQALPAMGADGYFAACAPVLARHPRSSQDEMRERHMAARLQRLLERTSGRILFLCGMAHWAPVRRHLQAGTPVLHQADGPPPAQVAVLRPHARSIPFLMGETPYLVSAYEQHRRGIDIEDFDPVAALKRMLLDARELHAQRDPASLEQADPPALRTLLDFARKMTVRRGQLLPDSYTLTVAANGVVGNDYALALLETAHRYPWNGELLDESEEAAAEGAPPEDPGAAAAEDDGRGFPPIWMTDQQAVVEEAPLDVVNRAPGTAFSYGRLRLERRPDPRRSKAWRNLWDPSVQCSWPPEDLVIEHFRDYVGQRALSLARVAHSRAEPFSTSFLDGVDFRETLRDVTERRVWVREEPKLPGGVGALVIVFEEDSFGERYPWRATWHAEHHNESTLAFYATDFRDDVLGPGVARASYGGCMLVFPPKLVPDVWEDLRFERARTPSERLLLAAIFHAGDHYVVHLGRKPPGDGVKAEASRRGKHILHLPLSTFSARMLERIRRVHVLNGRQVRSWAHRFIR